MFITRIYYVKLWSSREIRRDERGKKIRTEIRRDGRDKER